VKFEGRLPAARIGPQARGWRHRAPESFTASRVRLVLGEDPQLFPAAACFKIASFRFQLSRCRPGEASGQIRYLGGVIGSNSGLSRRHPPPGQAARAVSSTAGPPATNRPGGEEWETGIGRLDPSRLLQ